MTEDGTGQAPTSPDARLDSLEQRLERAKTVEAERSGIGDAKPAQDEQLGNRVLSYLLGGLLGGALIGWVLDRLFGTGNLLLVIFLVLGTVGGFWSIIRVATRGR